MRNFQEEVEKAQSPRAPHVSIFGKKIHQRVAYRAVLGVLTLLTIAATLLAVVYTSGSVKSGSESEIVARVVVILAPGFNPVVAESAMASNKAPNLAMLVSSGGSYGRVASNTTDATAALVSILTGSPISYHNVSSADTLSAFYGGAPSFLRYLRTSSLRTTIIASDKYYSLGSTPSNSTNCASVGILDVECVGFTCADSDSASYCSSLTKFIVSSDATALMGTTISTAFGDTADARALTLILTSAFEGNREDDDNSLTALSTTTLLDGVVGQVLINMAQRSYADGENWLVIVAGDGANALQQAPMFVGAYANGEVATLSPLRNSTVANIVDVFTTALTWLGISNPTGAVGVAEAICHDGSSTSACPR